MTGRRYESWLNLRVAATSDPGFIASSASSIIIFAIPAPIRSAPVAGVLLLAGHLESGDFCSVPWVITACLIDLQTGDTCIQLLKETGTAVKHALGAGGIGIDSMAFLEDLSVVGHHTAAYALMLLPATFGKGTRGCIYHILQLLELHYHLASVIRKQSGAVICLQGIDDGKTAATLMEAASMTAGMTENDKSAANSDETNNF